MSENLPNNVPYIVHEGSMARMERQLKRMFIAVIVAVLALFASNAAWLYAWCQYDYVSESFEAEQDGSGVNIIGGGDVNYGTDGQSSEKEAD